MAITEYGDISPRTAAYAYEEFLAHVEPWSVLAKFGVHKPIPRNKTTVGKFRRAVPYEALTAPLQEGVTPSVKGTTFEDVTVNLLQWGDVHGLTDVIQDTHEDPVLMEMMGLSGEQAQLTFEQVMWNIIRGGSSVEYGNGSDRSAVNTALSLDKQRAVVRTLMRNKGRKHTQILSGSTDIGTTPIEASYIAVCHTDVAPDIRELAGFTPVSEYGTMKPTCAQELGAVEDVRYICSPEFEPYLGEGSSTLNSMIAADATNVDVYPIIYMAKEFFGLTPLKNQSMGKNSNMAVQPTVVNPKPSASDPLGQRGYVGWKAYFNAVRLNETWGIRLEVGATDL